MDRFFLRMKKCEESSSVQTPRRPRYLLSAAQTSKSAVARVSKPAGRKAAEPTWKSAARQVWKPALRHLGRSVLNRGVGLMPGRDKSLTLAGLALTQSKLVKASQT